MKKCLSLSVLFAFSLLVNAQKKDFPVNVSVLNESTAIPFTRFFTIPVHPGMQLGTEFNYSNTSHSRLFQTANICYFYHNYLAQGVGLNSELGYEYRLKSGLEFTALLGVGYMHTFATTEEFTFINGEYEKRADRGNARFYPSVSLDLGYYLKKSQVTSPKLFIRYQSWAEYPYSPDFIPVMTHINLHVGAKLFIHLKSKENE